MSSQGYRYGYADFEVAPEGSSYAHAMSWIAPGSSVLDVGSGPGHFAGALSSAGCDVVCVELDEQAALAATQRCSRVLALDVGRRGWAARAGGPYDRVLMLDILEHLVDPESALREAASLLSPAGRVVVSVPNVAHATVRLPLLLGEWRYESEGQLDQSHLRFFVLEGLFTLLASSGLRCLDLRRVLRAPDSRLLEVASSALDVDEGKLWRLLERTEGMTWQYVVLARPTSEQPPEEEARFSTVDSSVDVLAEMRRMEYDLERLRRLARLAAPALAVRRWVLRLLGGRREHSS